MRVGGFGPSLGQLNNNQLERESRETAPVQERASQQPSVQQISRSQADSQPAATPSGEPQLVASRFSVERPSNTESTQFQRVRDEDQLNRQVQRAVNSYETTASFVDANGSSQSELAGVDIFV